jgi:hypothetical protein
MQQSARSPRRKQEGGWGGITGYKADEFVKRRWSIKDARIEVTSKQVDKT